MRPATTAGLDVYDVAFLAGGPDRAVDAALTALVQTGRVRLHEDGGLTVTDLRRRHPVEAAVLEALGPRLPRSAATVRFRAAGDRRLAEVRERLTVRRLLTRSGRRTLPGHQTLRRLRAVPPRDAVAGGTEALRVALGGPQVLTDQALPAALARPERHRRGAAAHWEPRAEAAWTVTTATPFGG